MGEEGWEERPAPTAPELPLQKVVPARAVLTELARAFLLVHEIDRKQAARFASTFLKERAAESGPRPPTPFRRRPTRSPGPLDSQVLR
ncbi:MAG: hypothetical protein L3K15_08025 [Thermoplasmata archaeon]|nr:hypothetical protein [Thermoplasmata archaeon]